MKITSDLLEAYLKSPTMGWLLPVAEPDTGHPYSEWVKSQSEFFRAAEPERQLAGTPEGEPRWKLVEPKSRAGRRVMEIPAPLVPFLVAHLEGLRGPNPLDLVFPSRAGTPLYPKNFRRRHFAPALRALGITGIRQHDFRRSFIAVHVQAGTHPKLLQERVGHSDIRLTMDIYGMIAGQMPLAQEQEARLDALAAGALPAALSGELGTNSGENTATDGDRKPAKGSDPDSAV